MCNAMFALKTGNAVIFAPHPKAERCTQHLTDAFMEVVKANGGPGDLVQTVKNGSVETTQELMKDVDVVVATGGGAMVRSAYSSGKPSYGVGAGNVPVIIDRDVDLMDAAEKIVTGASFDNGIICSHEQFVLAPEERYDERVKSFIATGRVWFTDDKEQVQKLREVVFHDGHLNKEVVGNRRARSGAGGHRRAGDGAHHPAAGGRRGNRGHSGQGEALPRRCHPALQDVRAGGRRGEGQPSRRGGRALGSLALQQ